MMSLPVSKGIITINVTKIAKIHKNSLFLCIGAVMDSSTIFQAPPQAAYFL